MKQITYLQNTYFPTNEKREPLYHIVSEFSEENSTFVAKLDLYKRDGIYTDSNYVMILDYEKYNVHLISSSKTLLDLQKKFNEQRKIVEKEHNFRVDNQVKSTIAYLLDKNKQVTTQFLDTALNDEEMNNVCTELTNFKVDTVGV